VSLEGTLETIALPDVFALLSVTAKTGELRVEAGHAAGSVWFDAGCLCGFDVGSSQTALDALFGLLRLSEGSFVFHAGGRPLHPVEPQDVVPLLEEAEARLLEWPGIAAVVPSQGAEVRLRSRVETTVSLQPEQWRLVAVIGGGRSVAEVLDAFGLGEFGGSKALKELIELGLVMAGEVDLAAAGEVASAEAAGMLTEEPYMEGGALEGGALEGGALEGGALEGGANGWAAPAGDSDDAFGDYAFGDGASVDGASGDGASGDGASDEEPFGDAFSEVWDDEAGDVLRSGGPEAPGEEEPVEQEVPAYHEDPVNRGLLLKFLGSVRN